jgi:hypothetical protein
MMQSNFLKRLVAIFVTVSFLSGYALPAWSGIVSTEQMLYDQLQELDRDSLVSLLGRQDVRQQLIEQGVDPDYAKQRIAALDDQQIREMQASIDQLPAGGSVVGLLVAVLLVLVILDIIGVTNIFSFINSPR